MSLHELTNMIANDELHIVFGEKLCEHLLEVNVRFKGDNNRVIMVRNVYKDGVDDKPIPHFDDPSLKYIYNNTYTHGREKGLPIRIPVKFSGKLEIQGKAANRYSVSDIDAIGTKMIKTILNEDCPILREYWFLNPDEKPEDLIRMGEIQEYLLAKYGTRRIK